MLCGWEGNCRAGVAMAMHHRLGGLSTCSMCNGHRKGDKHPAYAPSGVWHLYLYIYCRNVCSRYLCLSVVM